MFHGGSLWQPKCKEENQGVRNVSEQCDLCTLHAQNHRLYFRVKGIPHAFIGNTHISLWKLIPIFIKNHEANIEKIR
jgi:hypothetical protein